MVYYFRALGQLDYGRLSTAIKITGFPIIQLLTNELFVRSIISITTIHHKNQSLFTKPAPILDTPWILMNPPLI